MLKLLSATILDPKQRLLLSFQRKNVIDTETSGDSDDLDFKKVIESPHIPVLKLVMIRKVKNLINEYSGIPILDKIDQNLLRGLFEKRVFHAN
jgi:hypothetical protein